MPIDEVGVTVMLVCKAPYGVGLKVREESPRPLGAGRRSGYSCSSLFTLSAGLPGRVTLYLTGTSCSLMLLPSCCAVSNQVLQELGRICRESQSPPARNSEHC
jgi:hypothetical protein